MSIVKECRSFRPWIWNLGSLLKSGGWLTHTHSHTRSLDKKTGWCSSNTSKYMRYAFQLTFIPLFLSNFCRKSCLVAFWLDSLTPSFCFQYQHFSPFFHFFSLRRFTFDFLFSDRYNSWKYVHCVLKVQFHSVQTIVPFYRNEFEQKRKYGFG